METNKPRFVINTEDNNMMLTKAKYTKLTKWERLQVFAELACYGSTNYARYLDPGDPDNRAEAEKWFNNELVFLGKRDAQELRDVWDRAAETGDCSRMLFSAVKFLQDKYKEV